MALLKTVLQSYFTATMQNIKMELVGLSSQREKREEEASQNRNNNKTGPKM